MVWYYFVFSVLDSQEGACCMIELSIIIPVFNEERKVVKDINEAVKFFNDQKIRGEIMMVDDGSRDRSVAFAQEAAVGKDYEISIISNNVNRGKGYSVRQGMLKARGQYVMFADSGYCIRYEYALKALELLKKDACDIVHGSRKLPQSVIKISQPIVRRICSRAFRLYTIIFMGLPGFLTDTQCGFKVYKREAARKLYSESLTDGFTFDIDIILRALRNKYRIVEIPVEWSCDYDSRIKVFLMARRIIAEFAKIKKR